ncbi:hypothetical protein FGO68_gene2860 [Halteria grandinella]|uniref:Uncharacterized protein n=1 Tax=Halteria grandinella TaxID=5974 RepID=A0A8J8NXN6_HALGN|nr:hypothetical protein FGO68_gene2860 [Halteria grandinella]
MPENYILIKSISAWRQDYKYSSGKYLSDYFTHFECYNKSIKLDKYPDLSDESITQYMHMLDFTDKTTTYLKLDGQQIENYSILITKLLSNCKALEKIGTYRKYESRADSKKRESLPSRVFELPKGICKTLKEILIIGELTPDGNALYKAIVSACSDSIRALRLYFDAKSSTSYLAHANLSLIENLEVRGIDDSTYEYMMHMKNLKFFQTSQYGFNRFSSEGWKDEEQLDITDQQNQQKVSLLQISPHEDPQVKCTKQMINLLRSWPQLESLKYYWNYDFLQEISKLKNLKYFQPSGKTAIKSQEQLIQACQNKPKGFKAQIFSHSIKMDEVLWIRKSVTDSIIDSEINFKRFLNENQAVQRDQLLETVLRDLFVPV